MLILDRTIWLHIGFHRTGTSTIQYGLMINEGLLRDSDILFPKSARFNNRAHHNIRHELMNTQKLDSDKGKIKELIDEIGTSNAKKVIISSEGLCLLPPKKIGEFVKILSSVGKIKVIAFIREQTEFYQSWYALRVKRHGFKGDFKDFYDTFTKEEYPWIDGNYYKRLEPWSEMCGQDNLIIKIFEKSFITDHLFYEFLRTCEIDGVEKFKIPKNQNKSPGLETIEIYRKLSGNIKNENLMRIVFEYIALFSQKAGWGSTKYNIIPPELHNKIQRNINQSNRLLARKYFSRNKLFFDEYPAKPVTKFDLKSLNPEELLDMMAFMINKLSLD